MDTEFHKAQAHRLIRLCGGVEAASAICGGSPTAQMFSNYQNRNVKAFMPAHVIKALQDAVGIASYSDAMSAGVHPTPSKSLLEDAMGAARVAGSLPESVHEALSDGRIDEMERRALTAAADELRAIADGIQAALIQSQDRRAG